MIKTRITEMFGIERPIVQGGLMWIATAELTSAVANAGGIGFMTALSFPDAEALRDEIRKCREFLSFVILLCLKGLFYETTSQLFDFFIFFTNSFSVISFHIDPAMHDAAHGKLMLEVFTSPVSGFQCSTARPFCKVPTVRRTKNKYII